MLMLAIIQIIQALRYKNKVLNCVVDCIVAYVSLEKRKEGVQLQKMWAPDFLIVIIFKIMIKISFNEQTLI